MAGRPQCLQHPAEVERFLAAVLETGGIAAAARKVGLSRNTAYRRCRDDEELGMLVEAALHRHKQGRTEVLDREAPVTMAMVRESRRAKTYPTTESLTMPDGLDVEVINPNEASRAAAEFLGVDPEAVAAFDQSMPRFTGADPDMSKCPPMSVLNFLKLLWRDMHEPGTPIPLQVKARDLFARSADRAIERKQAQIDGREPVDQAGGGFVVMEVPHNPARAHLRAADDAVGE